MADYNVLVYGTDLQAAVCMPSYLVIHIIVYPLQPLGMVTAPVGPPGLMCVGFHCPYDTVFRSSFETFDLVAHKAPFCWMTTVSLLTVYNGQEPALTATVYKKIVGVMVPIASRRVAIKVGAYFDVSTLGSFIEYGG